MRVSLRDSHVLFVVDVDVISCRSQIRSLHIGTGECNIVLLHQIELLGEYILVSQFWIHHCGPYKKELLDTLKPVNNILLFVTDSPYLKPIVLLLTGTPAEVFWKPKFQQHNEHQATDISVCGVQAVEGENLWLAEHHQDAWVQKGSDQDEIQNRASLFWGWCYTYEFKCYYWFFWVK